MSGGNWLGRRRVWLVTVAWAMVVSIATVVLPVRPVAAACDDITVTSTEGGRGVAAAIEQMYPDDLESFAEALALHYELGGRADLAAAHQLTAGRKSDAVHAQAEARSQRRHAAR